jgi:hypothetical protein
MRGGSAVSKQFVFFRFDNAPSKPVGLTVVTVAAAKRLLSGSGPFALKKNEEHLGQNLTRRDVLRALRRRLSNGDVGDVYRVFAATGAVVFKVREVVEAAKVINTSGNAHSDEFWTWIVNTYPQFHPRFAGSYVCKDVAGTNTPSQHSYGNAVDVFFDSMAHQIMVFHDVEAGKCPVKVEHAISGARIWEPGSPEHAYTGEFHAHLHTDYIPQFSGACGVRN